MLVKIPSWFHFPFHPHTTNLESFKKKKKIKTSEDEGFGKFGNAIGLQDFLLESII